MSRLNQDGHDESQYLPRGTPPVNPFRAQHGKLEWVERTLHAKTWLPDILNTTLNDKGDPLLNTDNLTTCMRFYSSLVSTRKALGISDIRGYIADPQKGSNKPETDIFYAVMTGLLKYQSNLCLWIVCDEYNRGNLKLAEKMIGSICNSLDLAQNIIDNLCDSSIMQIVPAPESCPEIGKSKPQTPSSAGAFLVSKSYGEV